MLKNNLPKVDNGNFTIIPSESYPYLYIPVMWPDVQELMEYDDFHENSYLINDPDGYDDFGDSAYFVNFKWLREHGLE